MLPWGTCDSKVPESRRNLCSFVVPNKALSLSLVFGGCAFLPFSLGPTGNSLSLSLLCCFFGGPGFFGFSGTLDFGGFAFLPFSLGPAGDCPCRH